MAEGECRDEVGGRRPRLLYFITSYRSPDQLERLLQVLRSAQPAAELVVHHDVHATPLDPAVISRVGGHLLTSSFPILWDDLSLDRARWRVMRWALETLQFDWMVLLSEQDYPIASPGRISSTGPISRKAVASSITGPMGLGGWVKPGSSASTTVWVTRATT